MPSKPEHKPEAEPQPHFTGHRDRLRQRLVEKGADTLADYELLELVLFMAIPRRDVKPLAKKVIERFGGIAPALAASVAELTAIDGISENTAIALKSIEAAAMRMMQKSVLNQPVLNSWARLIDYCHAAMARQPVEQFRVLFLNRKNVLIADEVQQRGTVDQAPVFPREVVKRALELGATALVLVHNHPSGDPSPSQADIELTQAVIRAGEPLGIVVHDHLVISRSGHASFKSLMLL